MTGASWAAPRGRAGSMEETVLLLVASRGSGASHTGGMLEASSAQPRPTP